MSLAYQRYNQTSRRNNFDQKQEKDGQGNENADAEGNLFSAVAWKIEHKSSQKADTNTWDHQIDGVEQSFSS